LDPAEWFIICANMPGSCYGSTGPLSLNPATGERWYGTFPELTNRDVVRAFAALRKALGISRIDVLTGGSLGGQQVLEWALLEPDVINAILPMATNAVHSPWGIAFNAAQRMALEADPSFALQSADAGQAGLAAARAIGMLSYRTAGTFGQTQPRAEDQLPGRGEVFRADSYLRYQGQKLVQRFNAHAYRTLSRMMDSHDLGRGRGGAAVALSGVKCPALVVSIDTDLLFPPDEQEFLVQHLPQGELFTLRSPYGHDAFLIEFAQLDPVMRAFLARV
jgi:homoserine O-acetyltransferase